jgi:phage gp37-like protein
MAEISFKAVEDATLAALQAQLGSKVQTLESYQGDWQVDLRRETWRLPAVLVRLSRSRGEQVATRSYDLTLELTVLVAVRMLRGEAAARREPGGVYDLLMGVRDALWHQDLGLELLPLALVGEEALLNNRELAVYAARYRTTAVQDF